VKPDSSRRAPDLGGHITRVEPGSLGEAAGLQVGDAILSINGHVLRDVVDYRFYSADEELEIVFRRPPEEVGALHIVRTYGQDLGLEFAAPTFDGIRRCRNQCDFCFVRQMPAGLRKSLYIKDDDYRYSFLFGNFVTLTNLQEEDWARLAEQRLSPLYVSVQATDPSLRARLLGMPAAPDILTQIGRLGTSGIEVHAQVVIIPGLNDGQALEQTVHDLALCPAVSSIGLVPIGITRYHSCGLRTVTAQEAGQLVAWAKRLQREFRRQRGVGLVYPSDEFFLLADQPVPSARLYDGFPQAANGVGLTRLLLDDWKRVKGRIDRLAASDRRITLVCGMLIAPMMRNLAQELAMLVKSDVEVIPVPNAFLGETVTVSGLLLAEDVVNTLRAKTLGDLVVLPRVMFDAAGERTLDDQTQADIERQIGRPVAVADRMSDVVRLCRTHVAL
jgi:putative radical SAM enzyme (TIGR03279 family)